MLSYEVIFNTVVTILSAIITGGFVLVFIEIGNRKNREDDRYRQIMNPFMQKFSAYSRYILWVSPHIKNAEPDKKEEKHFKDFLRYEIGKYGSQLIGQGGNYDVDSFNASQIENIGENINNVWYMYDRLPLHRLELEESTSVNHEFIDKELAAINPQYLSIPDSVSKIAKVSGEFYTDIYQPIQYEPSYHERLMKLYFIQSLYVCVSIMLILFVLCLLVCVSLPLCVLKCIIISIVFLFGLSLTFLFVSTNQQLRLVIKVGKNIYEIKERINRRKH